MNKHVEQLKSQIEPLRQQIIAHPLYAQINDVESLRIFMQYHVFAVWDFMSLLKSLQNELTCTSIPWMPVGNADTRFLINEIVVGEESDVDQHGNRLSHFELYLQAMQQAGAATDHLQSFLDTIRSGKDVLEAINSVQLSPAIKSFLQFTFSTIAARKSHILAAVFTFGREDLIPGMFHSIIEDMDQQMPGTIDTFRYYLERHIEVDGDHHSHLALAMTEQLCGNDEQKWKEATQAAVHALQSRIRLWDGAVADIVAMKSKNVPA